MKNLLIVQPNKNTYSETFIQAHVEKLPFNVTLAHGGLPPVYVDDQLIVPGNIFFKTIQLYEKKILRRSDSTLDRFFIKRKMSKLKIDCVLAEFGPTGVALQPYCESMGIPLIVHFHGYDAFRLDVLKKYSDSYKKMFSGAGALVVVSEDMRNQLISLGAKKEKVCLNPCGIDIEKFKRTKVVKDPIFLSVGRFVSKKAPHLTILAFAEVYRKYPTAQLWMVGDGVGNNDLMDGCIQVVKALKLDKSVHFFGSQPHDKILELMNESRFFVQHSVVPANGDAEGTPVSILEASAMGMAVISTKHMGIKESVIDGVTGYLVDEYDIEAMTNRMIGLIQNHDLAEQMGSKGRIHIEANYSLDISINGLKKVIEQLIN